MYSAFIPGSAAHAFSVPAVTADGNPATWSLVGSRPRRTSSSQSFQNGADLVPGVLITVAGAGKRGQGDGHRHGDGRFVRHVGADDHAEHGERLDGRQRAVQQRHGADAVRPRRGLPGLRRRTSPTAASSSTGTSPTASRFDGSFFRQRRRDEHRRGRRRHGVHELPRTDGHERSLQDRLAHARADGRIQRHRSREHHPQRQVPEGGYFDPTVLIRAATAGQRAPRRRWASGTTSIGGATSRPRSCPA